MPRWIWFPPPHAWHEVFTPWWEKKLPCCQQRPGRRTRRGLGVVPAHLQQSAISANTRTRICLNSFHRILIYGVIFQHRAGPAGVDHPSTVLLAGVLVFQSCFQSHTMVEGLWCFPLIQPWVDFRWKSLTACTEDWVQQQKTQPKPKKKKKHLSLPSCPVVLIFPNHT